MSSTGPRKWKRGDIHPTTGLVFWAYDKRRSTGEQWMTPEAVAVERERQKARCRDAMKTTYAKAMGTVEGRLKWLLRARMRQAFGAIRQRKEARADAMLGASSEIVRAWIERQMEDGMTWDNMGRWHVDHIMPLAMAKDGAELVALCHYTNLRPLWAIENMIRPRNGSDLSSPWPRPALS